MKEKKDLKNRARHEGKHGSETVPLPSRVQARKALRLTNIKRNLQTQKIPTEWWLDKPSLDGRNREETQAIMVKYQG